MAASTRSLGNTMVAILVVLGAKVLSIDKVDAFLSPMQISSTSICHESSTSLFAKRNKPSMKERRKQRAKRQPGVVVDRGVWNGASTVNEPETVPSMVSTTTTTPDCNNPRVGDDDSELEESVAQASSLIESQRKSVEYLTFIRKRVEESFPALDAVKAIADKGYFVHDGFLSSGEDEGFGDELLSQMLHEGIDMLSNDKLQRDITRLGDGEYVAKIVGGEAYADCPRLTEYVVSLTRHLPPLLNTEISACENGLLSKLDSTASMGVLRMYDRKTRLGAESLLSNPDDDDSRPFGVVCGDIEGAENDSRRITAMLFLSSKDWDATNFGGGITIENNGELVGAIRDRIVLLSSDTCSHRQEPWRGADSIGMEQASCVTVHFVREMSN
ncbi:hypothetical protein ACHAWU_004000 [Discostella pseudostelligera]|uniref:Prolyl 4-hydroxylase alpha subunit domain-containing protein n=1 Tax=Discostella pseudostelligera TaxID=259834 RepID=A0ABD3MKB3_9STRA